MILRLMDGWSDNLGYNITAWEKLDTRSIEEEDWISPPPVKSLPINCSTCGWQNGASFFQREAELTGPRSAPLIWIFTRVKRGARLGAARFAPWTQFKRGRHIKESDEKVEDLSENIYKNCNDHYGRSCDSSGSLWDFCGVR